MGWAMRYFGFMAAGASFAILLAAHIFEMAGLQPCELCMQQRVAHWIAIPIGLIAGFAALGRRPPSLRRISLAVLALAYLGAAAIAGKHVAVEQAWIVEEACAAPNAGPLDEALHTVMVTAARPFGYQPPGLSAGVAALLSGGKAVDCATPQWRMLLTMAGWNLLACLGLAGLSVLAAWRRLRR